MHRYFEYRKNPASLNTYFDGTTLDWYLLNNQHECLFLCSVRTDCGGVTWTHSKQMFFSTSEKVCTLHFLFCVAKLFTPLHTFIIMTHDLNMQTNVCDTLQKKCVRKCMTMYGFCLQFQNVATFFFCFDFLYFSHKCSKVIAN